MKLEFIRYTGDYPCLCGGDLIIKTDGVERNLGCVLKSGGRVYFSEDYSESFVDKGRWEIDEDELPEDLKPYLEQLEDMVNDHVPEGCCGGCI